LPPACQTDAGTIERALAAAPGRVVLAGGTRLSDCVTGARQEGQLQTIGALLSAVADGLAPRAARSPRVALALGYLLGAVQRGASRTNGIHGELVRRLEQDGELEGAPAANAAALRRGVQAGRQHG
jgi:hypothetical protein